MTYSELQTAVADYLHRTDLTSKLPGFIALAESYLFRELQIKELRLSVSGVTTGEYFILPSDFSQVSRITASKSGVEYELDYAQQPYTYTLTYPTTYALENNQIRLFGASTGQAYTLYYTPKLSPLSLTNTSNWLLVNGSDVYLYATAMAAASHLRDDAQAAKLSAMLPTLIDSVMRFAERRGQPATGSLQIKPRR